MKSKITLLFISSFYLTLTANAQIKKGSISLGGQISFSHSHNQNTTVDNSDEKGNNGYISLSAGKAIKDNSVIGLTLQFGTANSHFTNNNPWKSTSNQYGAGIFYRRDKTVAKDFYIFFQGGLNYGYSESNYDDSTGNKISKSTQSGMSLGLASGVSYKIFKNFHLEVTLPQLLSVEYYRSKSTQQTVINKSENFSFYSSLNGSTLEYLGVGFRFIF